MITVVRAPAPGFCLPLVLDLCLTKKICIFLLGLVCKREKSSPIEWLQNKVSVLESRLLKSLTWPVHNYRSLKYQPYSRLSKSIYAPYFIEVVETCGCLSNCSFAKLGETSLALTKLVWISINCKASFPFTSCLHIALVNSFENLALKQFQSVLKRV